MAFFAFFRRNP